jgi:hypothetical protein
MANHTNGHRFASIAAREFYMKIIYLALPVFLYALGYAHAADGNNGTGQDNKKTYVIHSDDQHSYAEEIGPNGKYFLLLNSMNKKGIDQFLHQQPNSADVLLDRSAANLKWKPSNFKFIKIPEAAQSASAEQPGGQVDKGVSTGRKSYLQRNPSLLV